jgi:hypothetical protein
MSKFDGYSSLLAWPMAVLLSALAVGCGGGGDGRDPVLGIGGIAVLRPTVTAAAPVNNTFGVPVNNTIITAAFSEPMNPITGTATFTVTCAAPCVNPTGTVALDATRRIATFTLTPATALAPLTLYTATVTGATSIATGLALASPYVWQFTTGLTGDSTRPRVTLTAPVTTIPGPTPGVPANTAITAVFTEDMAPATIIAAGTFAVTCGAPCVSPVAGIVTYSVGSRTAIFTPAAALAVGTTYTATITTAATDLAANQLAGNQGLLPAASNYVWTFTAAAAVAPANVLVLSKNPLAGAIGVCPGATVNATFSVPSGFRMDPLTVNAATFVVTGPAPGLIPVVAASVVLDGTTGRIATFTPFAPLTAGTTYTATIKGGALGVMDLAIPANAMLGDVIWNFTAGICVPPPAQINLGAATAFAIAATAGVTNTPTVPLTQINGNVVLDPGATCNAVAINAAGGFGLCGGAPPTINGTVISPLYPDAGATSGAVKAALRAAFIAITPPAGPPAAGSLGGATNIPAGTTMGAPAGSALVQGDNLFVPGVYQSLTSILITGDLTLDAQGDPNALFIFQSSSTVGSAAGAPTPGVHTRILLINGAKASNVFWQAGTSATLGAFSEFQGNILASADITMVTGATSCGRLFAGAFTAGAFVFDTNVVSVPGNGCPL